LGEKRSERREEKVMVGVLGFFAEIDPK